MQLGQSARQRKPEASAFMIAAEPGVNLAERLQRYLDFSLVHANAGIAHRKCDFVGPGLAHGDDDRSARLGELDGIRQQVEENLLQPHCVGEDRRQSGVDIDREAQSARVRPLLHQRNAGIHDSARIDVIFQVEIKFPSIHLS